MRILISSCLIGKKCAYNGKIKRVFSGKKALEGYDLIDICPEMSGGLPCPREKYEISGGDGYDVLAGKARVMSESGKDETESFVNGARRVLRIAKQNGVKIAVLKGNSPSCGCRGIYSGRFDEVLKKGCGVTAAMLLGNDIKVFSEKEVFRLSAGKSGAAGCPVKKGA